MHGILYYTTISGNTALVAEAVQGILWNIGITLILQNLSQDITWQNEVDFMIFGCGTYGHGQLQSLMRTTLENTWKNRELKNIPCAAIGLGDHRYDQEYNMYAADHIESWIIEHGGNLISPALRINRSPLKQNNQKIIENWAKSFINNLHSIRQ